MATDSERVALAAFVAQAVLAGGNAVGIRFSNRELAPLWGAGLRFALAAALLLTVMAVLRRERRQSRAAERRRSEPTCFSSARRTTPADSKRDA